MMRHFLDTVCVVALGWALLTPCYADQVTPPVIPLGTGVLNALGQNVGNQGAFLVDSGSWTNPVVSDNVSGEQTTGLASVTSGAATISAWSNTVNYANGMGIAVTGAGPSGALLVTTVLTSTNGVPASLATNASTTVPNGVIFEPGTIGATSNVLTLASTYGWSIGMGIDIATVGTAGADLITSVTAVSATTLTLAAFSVSAGTNVKVNHDDTAGIIAAIASKKHVRLPIGNYNVTSQLLLANIGQWFQCDGAGIGSGGTTIWNRGKTNNVFNITIQHVALRDCGVVQAYDVTPTAGCGI